MFFVPKNDVKHVDGYKQQQIKRKWHQRHFVLSLLRRQHVSSKNFVIDVYNTCIDVGLHERKRAKGRCDFSKGLIY